MPYLEAERPAGSGSESRVREAEEGGDVAGADAHDSVGDGGEACDDDEADGVEGSCDTDREAACGEVAADLKHTQSAHHSEKSETR